MRMEKGCRQYLVVGSVLRPGSRDFLSESFPHVKFFRLEQFTSKFLKNGVENFEKQLWLAVQSSSSAVNIIQRVQLFCGPVLEISCWTVFTSTGTRAQAPEKSRNIEILSQNNIGWLYSPSKILPTLFTGYRSFADPFSRQSASCEWRQRPTPFLYCSKCRALLALTPLFRNTDKCWTDSAISAKCTRATSRATTTATNRCKLLLYNWQSCNNPNLKLFHLCGAGQKDQVFPAERWDRVYQGFNVC